MCADAEAGAGARVVADVTITGLSMARSSGHGEIAETSFSRSDGRDKKSVAGFDASRLTMTSQMSSAGQHQACACELLKYVDIGVSVRATMPAFNDLDTSDDSEDAPAALGQLLAAIATSIGSGFPSFPASMLRRMDSAKPPDGPDVLRTSIPMLVQAF